MDHLNLKRKKYLQALQNLKWYNAGTWALNEMKVSALNKLINSC